MKLAEVMKTKKVTAQQLADISGIPKRSIEGYRAGRREPSFSVGLIIAKALEVDPYDLLDEVNEK